MLTQDEKQMLDGVLAAYDYNPTNIIVIMQQVQKEYRYLPKEALCYLAKELKVSEAKIYGVATFYEN